MRQRHALRAIALHLHRVFHPLPLRHSACSRVPEERKAPHAALGATNFLHVIGRDVVLMGGRCAVQADGQEEREGEQQQEALQSKRAPAHLCTREGGRA